MQGLRARGLVAARVTLGHNPRFAKSLMGGAIQPIFFARRTFSFPNAAKTTSAGRKAQAQDVKSYAREHAASDDDSKTRLG
jgi:hypothetical protein